MSNTSDLTPYDTTISSSGGSGGIGLCAGVAAACAVGAIIGVVALASWLSEETPEDRAAVLRLEEDRRRNRIKGCSPTKDLSHIPVVDLSGECGKSKPITTIHLNTRHMESFLETARKLGYRLEPLVQPSKPISRQPQLLLRGASGQRLVLQRNARGRIAVSTAGGEHRILELVHRHTLDRATEHLRHMGMHVETARLSSGEVQIRAREQAGRRGGAAEVKAQVRSDGRVWIDVDNIRGNRCEEIVSGFAEAIGAEVSGTKKKDAYYQLPGEPARTSVRVPS